MKEEVILWIIRWGDPYALECKTMTRSEVEAYAREKQNNFFFHFMRCFAASLAISCADFFISSSISSCVIVDVSTERLRSSEIRSAKRMERQRKHKNI